MESQRDNTRIAYSWIGNVFLVLTSALIIFGLSTSDGPSFFPAMGLGIGLAIIWAALTEVFAAYTRERFKQAELIEKRLGIVGMAISGRKRFEGLGKLQYFCQARTYVVLFTLLYIGSWISAAIAKF